jgi:hypothetical protein
MKMGLMMIAVTVKLIDVNLFLLLLVKKFFQTFFFTQEFILKFFFFLYYLNIFYFIEKFSSNITFDVSIDCVNFQKSVIRNEAESTSLIEILNGTLCIKNLVLIHEYEENWNSVFFKINEDNGGTLKVERCIVRIGKSGIINSFIYLNSTLGNISFESCEIEESDLYEVAKMRSRILEIRGGDNVRLVNNTFGKGRGGFEWAIADVMKCRRFVIENCSVTNSLKGGVGRLFSFVKTNVWITGSKFDDSGCGEGSVFSLGGGGLLHVSRSAFKCVKGNIFDVCDCNCTLDGCDFVDVISSKNGSVINSFRNDSSSSCHLSLLIWNCNFDKCESRGGAGGAVCARGCDMSIINSVFVECSVNNNNDKDNYEDESGGSGGGGADGGGGAIYYADSYHYWDILSPSSSSFSSSHSSPNCFCHNITLKSCDCGLDGGSICVHGGRRLNVSGCGVENSTARACGGGISIFGAGEGVAVERSVFVNCRSGLYGGGVYMNVMWKSDDDDNKGSNENKNIINNDKNRILKRISFINCQSKISGNDIYDEHGESGTWKEGIFEHVCSSSARPRFCSKGENYDDLYMVSCKLQNAEACEEGKELVGGVCVNSDDCRVRAQSGDCQGHCKHAASNNVYSCVVDACSQYALASCALNTGCGVIDGRCSNITECQFKTVDGDCRQGCKYVYGSTPHECVYDECGSTSSCIQGDCGQVNGVCAHLSECFIRSLSGDSRSGCKHVSVDK